MPHAPPGYAVTGMTTTGVVVGWAVPPAGSTVIPSRSPAGRRRRATGAAEPALVTVSRPADLAAPDAVITQSW